jgi:hypothetical protein
MTALSSSITYPPKLYDELRRIRVGRDANKQEMTMRFFVRSSASAPSPGKLVTLRKRASKFVSKTYVGLTDIVSSQNKIITWDPRYKQSNSKKRIEAIMKDWLDKFDTLDVAANEETPKKKKPKIVHQDDTFKAFMNGESLTTKNLQRIGREVASVLRLKEIPQVVSTVHTYMSRSI